MRPQPSLIDMHMLYHGAIYRQPLFLTPKIALHCTGHFGGYQSLVTLEKPLESAVYVICPHKINNLPHN
jgi:hypothetical protein